MLFSARRRAKKTAGNKKGRGFTPRLWGCYYCLVTTIRIPPSLLRAGLQELSGEAERGKNYREPFIIRTKKIYKKKEQ